MQDLLIQTYQIALPPVLAYIIYLLKDRKKKEDANAKGTMLLLRVQLIEYHNRYMKLGKIPAYAYENFSEMYKAYHELGGNGMVTHMLHDIQKLEIGRSNRNEQEVD